MGWFEKFIAWRRSGGASGIASGLFNLGGLASAEDGNPVSPADAVTISAIWGAVQILSDAMVGLPFHVKDQAQEKVDHAAARLLRNDGEANPDMSAVAAKGALMANLALWGNAYAAIDREGDGTPRGLYPLPSSVTRPGRTEDGRLVYVTQLDGPRTLNAQDVLHVIGPVTLDGVVGLSPVEWQRRTVGLSLALERFAAKFFSQGGNIGGIVETPPMKEEARENFIKTWRSTYTGPDAAFKIAALPGGMKFHRTTADPKESQSVESREHQVREVARIWRIPPHMLGDMQKASYASIEMQNIEFYQGTVQPYVVRMEAEIGRKLLAESEKGKLSARFNMDAKLRGTTTERYAAYQTGRQGGWLSTNDVRRMENMPPIEGGDNDFLTPLNMTPTGGIGAGGAGRTK